MNYPIEDYIINFLARKESPEDVQKLKEWLATDPAHRDELKQWLAAWDAAGIMEAAENINTDKAYLRFMSNVEAGLADIPASNTSPKIIRMDIFRTIRRIAAIFVISFSLGILTHYYWTNNQHEQVAFVEMIVPPASRSNVLLPDGSTVSLNAGSTLRYPADYGKAERDIYLSGEGYFKVAQQAGKPFTVHTPLANITALGTEFNVMAYPDENVMETTLITGEVAVENGEAVSAFDRTILKPGQKLSLTVKPDAPLVPVVTQLEPYIAEAEVSWKERDWRLESVPLKDLAVKLERRYNVHIHVDDLIKSYRFTGSITDESMEQMLHIMQISAPILFNIDGKDVYIHVDPKKME